MCYARATALLMTKYDIYACVVYSVRNIDACSHRW